jgi:hypothetical protein
MRAGTEKGLMTRVVRKVRGRPFQPGNPGRPPGSRNKVTQTLEQLAEAQAEQLFQKVLEPIREVSIHDEELATRRCSMMRIMAR